MRLMLRLRALGALGVAVCVVAEYSLIGHASSSWSLVGGHMSEARELPDAVVLNDGRVLAIGGVRLGAVSAAVDVYDPGTNSWAAPAASLLVDDVPTAKLLASTEIYDPTQDRWTAGPDLPFPTFAPRAVTLADGRVFVVGGFTSDGYTSSTAFYDPATAAWTAGPRCQSRASCLMRRRLPTDESS